MIGEKIVRMRKIAEMNCLPQRYIWKKIVCRDHLCYARFGELKKNCLHSPSGGKNLQALNRWWKKFPASQKSRYPPGKNNGPSLKRLLAVSSTHIRFVGD